MHTQLLRGGSWKDCLVSLYSPFPGSCYIPQNSLEFCPHEPSSQENVMTVSSWGGSPVNIFMAGYSMHLTELFMKIHG